MAKQVQQLREKTTTTLAAASEGEPSDQELRDLWSWSSGQDQGPWPTQYHCFARAVLARWGRPVTPPAPAGKGEPGPSVEELGPLIAWLSEQAVQAADANQSTDAGMLTWAAQIVSERVDEDAPAPPAPLEGEANVGSEIWNEAVANSDSDDECRSFQRGAKWAFARWGRPAAPLEQLSAATPAVVPVPVSERPWEREGWCDGQDRCWLLGKVQGDWRLLDPVNTGVPQLRYTFSHSLPAHAIPLPTPQGGEVE